MKESAGMKATLLLMALCFLGVPARIFAHGGDTSLIHGCLNNKGRIRIVDASVACKVRETALDWNISGPAGPTGPAGPQGLQGPAAPPLLAVYDANNIFVGPVVGISSSGGNPFVAMMVDDIAYVLEVFFNRFLGNSSQVNFETANCSGLPYLSENERPIPPTTVVANIVYVADTTVPIANVPVGSKLQANGSCILGSGIDQVYPATQLDLGTLFSPPYKIR